MGQVSRLFGSAYLKTGMKYTLFGLFFHAYVISNFVWPGICTV